MDPSQVKILKSYFLHLTIYKQFHKHEKRMPLGRDLCMMHLPSQQQTKNKLDWLDISFKVNMSVP